MVSSALVLMEEIIRERYSPASGTSTARRPATATTGTTTAAAAASCWSDKLLPLCRYFAYVQVAEEEQNLWEEYAQLLDGSTALRDAQGHRAPSQIYPVFRDLFKKEGRASAA